MVSSVGCGGLVVRLLTFFRWPRFWQVLCGHGLAFCLLTSAEMVLPLRIAEAAQPESGNAKVSDTKFSDAEVADAKSVDVQVVQPEDAVRFCERAWFERAHAAAGTDAARRQVARLAAAVREESLQRSAWLDEVDCLEVAWSRPADRVSATRPAGCFAWADQAGFHVVDAATGRPVWGGGVSGQPPLFPRNHGLESTALVRDTAAGPVAFAAGRLLGVVSLRMAGPVSSQLVALDLAPAAEGRLIWCQPFAKPLVLSDVGMVADASLCVVVHAADEPGILVRALDVSDGRLVWQQTVPTGQPTSVRNRSLVAIYQHLLVLVLPTGQLIGLDRADGRTVWQRDDLRDLISSSPGMVADAVAGCADRLVVLLRPAAGMPEVMHFSGADGSLLGRSQLVLESGVASASTASDITVEMRRAEGRGAAWLGPPTVLAGRAVWPANPIAGSPPAWLLVSDLASGIMPFTRQEAPATVSASLRPINEQPDADMPPLSGLSGQRLGVLAGGRLWCLAPSSDAGDGSTPGAVD